MDTNDPSAVSLLYQKSCIKSNKRECRNGNDSAENKFYATEILWKSKSFIFYAKCRRLREIIGNSQAFPNDVKSMLPLHHSFEWRELVA